MLKFFRKHARGWFMLAVIAIIIIVFVLYFGSNRGGQTASVIAIVDGRTISDAEFRNEYEKLLDMVRQRYGANLSPELLKQLDLKQKVYNSLISKQVIISKAADLKVQVSDEELKNMIMYMPALQTNGVFDERKYRQMLRYNRVSAEDFEAMQKVTLMAAKIESLVREGIKVSEREIYDIFILQNQKINLNYIQISGQNVSQKVNPTKAQLESYLSSNSNLFRRPEQVKIKYLYFSSDSFSSAGISDSEVRDYYNLNKDKFRKKDGKQLSLAEARNDIIKQFKQIRGMQKAYLEAKKARDVIYQEENFEEYSNKNSLKITNLDFFPLNKPPKEFTAIKDFATEIIDMRKGEISKIIAAENGYYLLKLSDKKPAFLPQLKDIESEVRKHFMTNEANQLAAEEAQKISKRLKAGESFDKVAHEKGLPIKETGFFMPGDTIPKLGFNRDAAEILFQLSAAKPCAENPLYINNAYVILKLKGVSNVDMKDFEAKKDIYKKMLTSIKQEEAMQSWLEGNKLAMIKEKRINIKREAKDL
jgi:peptidyl-prolyl cis-trans isomerase D